MTTDLRKAVAKAYKQTDLYALRQLLAEKSRWQRKATIARNKLADVSAKIEAFAEKLAQEKAGVIDDAKDQTSES